MKETDRICHHPNWPPYNPMTGEKINPAKIWACDCGGNWHCPVCGFGCGSWPCQCKSSLDSVSNRVDDIVSKYKERFFAAWKDLAATEEKP